MFKPAILAAALILAGCQAKTDPAPISRQVEAPSGEAGLARYPIKKQFACLPEEAAFMAGHRGTSKKQGLAENSASSLSALIKHGVLFAEVDVAGLKDGTHILFHDGVWDEKSTGRGAVAASRLADAQNYLLHDTEGGFTAERPLPLKEALKLAKDRIYLEIDFKSSAKYEHVINAIDAAGMSDQVILIAYSRGQAVKLARLAPDMMISVSTSAGIDEQAVKASGVPLSQMAAWIGGGPYDREMLDILARHNIPALAWPKRNEMEAMAGPASLLITDYALKNPPILGLTPIGRQVYENCLSGG